MTRSTAIHDRVAEAILDAAARLLVERGEPPRLADVAAAAGVARATLYRHFPTRERLLEALTAVALDATATGLAEAGLDAVPVPEGIARVARVVAAGGSKYAAMIDRHGPGYDGAVEQQIGTMIRALLQRGVDDGTFRSDLSVDELAYLFGQLLQAAAHMTAEQVAGVEKAAALVSTVFLHGTQNRTDPAPQPGTLSEHPLPLLPEEGDGGGDRPGLAVDGLGDPAEDVLSGRSDRAVEHEQVGVEQRAGVGQRAADAAAQVAEQALQPDVAGLGQAEHAGEGQRFLIGRLRQVDHLGADRPDEAAAAPAYAHRPVVADLHVGQFPGEAGRAAVQQAADDEAGTDAMAAELEVNLVRLTAPRAEHVLAQGTEVGVIFEQRRASCPPRQFVGQAFAEPCGHPLPALAAARCRGRPARATLDGRGHAQHDRGGRARVVAGRTGCGLQRAEHHADHGGLGHIRLDG